jgi:hypothetical protein
MCFPTIEKRFKNATEKSERLKHPSRAGGPNTTTTCRQARAKPHDVLHCHLQCCHTIAFSELIAQSAAGCRAAIKDGQSLMVRPVR